MNKQEAEESILRCFYRDSNPQKSLEEAAARMRGMNLSRAEAAFTVEADQILPLRSLNCDNFSLGS